MTLIPAVILAGGKATRMGGGDKCRLHVQGRSILSHILERLEQQAAPVALNANGDPTRFADTGLPVLADGLPDYPGPLAGILAGLEWAAELNATHLLTVAGDTPFFPNDLLARLQEAQVDGGIVLAASGIAGGKMWRHPVFGLWPVALRGDLRDALTDGLRKIVLWTDSHGATTAPFSAEPFDPFHNINTPEDMIAAEGMV
jgi:molybdopterin-guanine dinucleotide biosynthesis protein A